MIEKMKSPIIETLRINAKAAPLFADIMNAAADELEQTKERLAVATEALEEIKARPAYSNGADVIASAALIKIEKTG